MRQSSSFITDKKKLTKSEKSALFLMAIDAKARTAVFEHFSKEDQEDIRTAMRYPKNISQEVLQELCMDFCLILEGMGINQCECREYSLNEIAQNMREHLDRGNLN